MARVSDPQGLAFSSLAEDYDRGRYGWPPEVAAGLKAATVLDLAAGTGKLTGLLVSCYPKVIAVEPLATMRSLLEQRVPEARALAGSAEAIPLDDASVDAVFVAEAFHWFDSNAAAKEIARVLRPSGSLVVCFNEWRGGFQPQLPEEVRAYWREVTCGLPPAGGQKLATGEWRRGLQAFEPLDEEAFDHEWQTDAEGVAAYYASVSSMGSVAARQRERWRDKLVEMIPPARYRLSLTTRIYRGNLSRNP
jgi:SAM-dependent methyltransferase